MKTAVCGKAMVLMACIPAMTGTPPYDGCKERKLHLSRDPSAAHTKSASIRTRKCAMHRTSARESYSRHMQGFEPHVAGKRDRRLVLQVTL